MVLFHFEKNPPHFELLQSNALPQFDFLSTIQVQNFIHRSKERKLYLAKLRPNCRLSGIDKFNFTPKIVGVFPGLDAENIIFKNLYPTMMTETGHLVGRSINNYSVGREQVSKTQV
ncbi:hypothetical protein T11_6406 [Trichinella zimbabwensis]|uniref:Uncharacterized protein n=1 Tax=Trichinella zimbabwensis TaxID=268475 RepID=A0A0V1HX10_9BILA|nr:hypothetical protein T11_6406 [Trichinella zimbabwensis]